MVFSPSHRGFGIGGYPDNRLIFCLSTVGVRMNDLYAIAAEGPASTLPAWESPRVRLRAIDAWYMRSHAEWMRDVQKAMRNFQEAFAGAP